LIEKSTVHKFTFYEASVEVEEYPHDRPDEGRVDVDFDIVKDVSFWEDANGVSYITFYTDGLYMKVNGKNFWKMLESQLEYYKKRRKELGYDKLKSKK